jgi:hypothetical protein
LSLHISRGDFTVFFEAFVETHGPLGTLMAGLGLGAFYLALIWVNLLLGHFLTPLFLIPLTWVQDAVGRRKGKAAA